MPTLLSSEQASSKRNACGFSTFRQFGPKLPHLLSCIPFHILTVPHLHSFINRPSQAHPSAPSVLFNTAIIPALRLLIDHADITGPSVRAEDSTVKQIGRRLSTLRSIYKSFPAPRDILSCQVLVPQSCSALIIPRTGPCCWMAEASGDGISIKATPCS